MFLNRWRHNSSKILAELLRGADMHRCALEGTLKELGCKKHSKTAVEGDVGFVNKMFSYSMLQSKWRTTNQGVGRSNRSGRTSQG
jgi:hypothetical protein